MNRMILKSALYISSALFILACNSKPKINPVNIVASSALKPTPNYMYEPQMLNDGNPNTAWAEGVPGDGVGEFLLFTFNNQVQIDGLQIINGFSTIHPQLGDLYVLNNRVRAARIEFEDGIEEIYLKDDVKKHQSIKFSKSHMSNSAKLIIVGVYLGSRWKDTCISEVAFFGKRIDRDKNHQRKFDHQWYLAEKSCNLQDCRTNIDSSIAYEMTQCNEERNRRIAADNAAIYNELEKCEKKYGTGQCGDEHIVTEYECVQK